MKNLIEKLNISNIIFTNSKLDEEDYLDFFSSLDCYVNVSKGEGFSVCPREALALGIPCILTDNSAQSTICQTNFVRAIPSLIEEPTNYEGFFGVETVGLWWNCEIADIAAALSDVYENYETYHYRAQSGKEWVKQYLWKNMRAKYLNLIKPKQIILGPRNEITEDYMMTDSDRFFLKMSNLRS